MTPGYGESAMGLSYMSDEVQQSPGEDWGLNRAQYWKLKFCWMPKQCYLSKKSLWGKLAYHGENWITGPGEPVIEHFWIERNEFLVWQLTK